MQPQVSQLQKLSDVYIFSAVIFTLTLRLCCHGCSLFGKELLKETAAGSYWAKLGISLEALPVEQSYIKSETAAWSVSSDDVLGVGLCSLLLTPKFKVPWITKWGFLHLITLHAVMLIFYSDKYFVLVWNTIVHCFARVNGQLLVLSLWYKKCLSPTLLTPFFAVVFMWGKCVWPWLFWLVLVLLCEPLYSLARIKSHFDSSCS